MSFQVVQLVGTPNEVLLEAIRRELNQEALVQAIETPDLQQAGESIPALIPDLVIFFTDSLKISEEERLKAAQEEMKKNLDPDDELKTLDAILCEMVSNFCQQIRTQLSEHRPIIVISSEEANKEERINYFLSGADDYLTADIEEEEFTVRLLAHLRRNVELLSHSQTRLPGLVLFSRLIQRKINLQLPWALLMIELDHFGAYTEVYGKIPSEQIFKTLAALLKSATLPPDIVGQTDTENFLVLTSPEKAENMAKHLCEQFDAVVSNFYSERDQKRGYIVSVVNEQISQRVPFVNLSIGVASSESLEYTSYMSVINTATEMKKLARTMYGSSWTSESKKLKGSVSAEPDRIRKILVMESDAAMAYLLKTTLEMQGYQVDTAMSKEEAQGALEQDTIDLLLIDPLIHGESGGLDLCVWIRQQEAIKAMHIICMSSMHDREEALNAGADLYLPKPFELTSLFDWVDQFLKG